MSDTEMIPLGTSRLEQAGIPFREEVSNDMVVRYRDPQPTSARILSIKNEDGEGGGPVWIDGEPFAEIWFKSASDDDTPYWGVAWYSRQHARRIARALGAEVAEA